MRSNIQVSIFALLILILAVVSALLVSFYPLSGLDLFKPLISFFLFTLVSAIAKEIKNRKEKGKGFKLVFPKIKKRKPPKQ